MCEEFVGDFGIRIWVYVSGFECQYLGVVSRINLYQDKSVVWLGKYMSGVGCWRLGFNMARGRYQSDIFWEADVGDHDYKAIKPQGSRDY